MGQGVFFHVYEMIAERSVGWIEYSEVSGFKHFQNLVNSQYHAKNFLKNLSQNIFQPQV